jgi:uncharacterized protein with HEPN domain
MNGPERRSVEDWLNDIVQWGDKVSRYVAGMTWEEFTEDDRTQDAVAKCVEAIGEAAGQLMRMSPDIQERYPTLVLREAYAARNKLSHGYFAIDLGLLWGAATKSVPAIVHAARSVLASLGTANEKDDEHG